MYEGGLRFFMPASNPAFLRAPCTLAIAIGDVAVEAQGILQT